ncbi:MAG TPA: glycosyltransferase [Pirellulales bacterium]|jgi:glycosyltransferase involved in cell wall biosynthesis|nr:glycosyltransferase [Pirellulales bacterium]
MITTCLINSYNYARFVGDAVDSALAQSAPFDEIIVVDDGSNDGSPELLAKKYGQHPRVQIVCKPNAGQLSCFNDGFTRARGDVVFFLDADDVYQECYLETALDIYRREAAVDFVFCGHRQFGDREALKLLYPNDRDLGYSVILAAYLREWIGAPTSCLSMRRSVLEKILPLPFVDEWRTRADDCLVFGASLAGARKYYLAQPLVRYRVHGANAFCGRPADRFAAYRRRLAVNRLFEYLERKFFYNLARLADLHHREFCTIGRPTLAQFAQYLRIGMASRVSAFRLLGCIAEMTRHWLRTSMKRPADAVRINQPPADPGASPSLRIFDTTDTTVSASAESSSAQTRRAA